MEQKLFTELRPLYATRRGSPNEIRIRVRLRDLVDPITLRHAVDVTMGRYPYFCVELQKRDGEFVFAENSRSVVVAHSLHGVELNSEESNYHMIAFAWSDNWIQLDVFHGMTDGTGAYEVIRTLLHYYCSERYHLTLGGGGVRLAGDEIALEEWADPVREADLPAPSRTQLPKTLDLLEGSGIEDDHRRTVFSIAVSESEFMRFNLDNDGSPGTMVSLFLSRAIARVNHEATDPIRITLCVNQRTALHAPRAHQSLVGGAMLEYKEKMRSWPIDRQATVYRGMVFAQTQEEVVLEGVSNLRGLTQLLLSKESDQERVAIADMVTSMGRSVASATVSYVGKANFGEAERYIRDFRLWTLSSTGITIEISAVNGRFTLDFIQIFSDATYLEAFLRELEENDIEYDLQDVCELELADIRVPWEG